MVEEELGFWLLLHRIPGMGSRRFLEALKLEKSLSDCFSGFTPRSHFLKWCQAKGIPEFVPDWKGVEQDLNWALEHDNHIVTYNDDAYPLQLKQISLPPPVLFVKGQVKALKNEQIAIVGTRYPTAQGRQDAYTFAAALASHGFTITSGLALGIDAASHEGALSAGITIAVLGNSLEGIYPAKHRELGAKIAQEGALVSEFSIGTPPKPENFPQRNRLISGLSLGVLVVEAAIKSGSLITANYALDQGREIFAIPGSIHNPMAKGCHHLIRQGAKCVESLEHILEEFPMQMSLGFQLNKERNHQKPSLKPKPQSKEDLPSILMQFLAHISDVCTPIDTVVDRTGLTVTEVSSMLLQLEMAGRVACVPGGYIRVGTGG
ncbi:MAG: DNA-protecting protein DprA [Proteobacteria bacterium]|nr:DNA-protecting protein DprA [Pseudomonadota bacterium]